ALFQRSFYLQFSAARYACVGDLELGRGPLNALVRGIRMPALGERILISTDTAALWSPPPIAAGVQPDLRALRRAAAGRVPEEGLGCLILGEHNALCTHAQPALEALERWL